MKKILSILLLSASMYASAQSPTLITDFGYQPYFTEGRLSFFIRQDYQPGEKYKNGAIEVYIVTVKCKEKLYKSELQMLMPTGEEPKIIDTATNNLLSKKFTHIPDHLKKLSENLCKVYSK